MGSVITITRRKTPAGYVYMARVSDRYGDTHAGDTAAEAALFAIRAMRRYACTNPEGGDLVAPPDVLAHVPRELRAVAGELGNAADYGTRRA